VLEIARDYGAPVLVPFTRAVVPIVDLAERRIVLEPSEGLLDPPVSARRAEAAA
jgi:16S rRNA processing protein RimM